MIFERTRDTLVKPQKELWFEAYFGSALKQTFMYFKIKICLCKQACILDNVLKALFPQRTTTYKNIRQDSNRRLYFSFVFEFETLLFLTFIMM